MFNSPIAHWEMEFYIFHVFWSFDHYWILHHPHSIEWERRYFFDVWTKERVNSDWTLREKIRVLDTSGQRTHAKLFLILLLWQARFGSTKLNRHANFVMTLSFVWHWFVKWPIFLVFFIFTLWWKIRIDKIANKSETFLHKQCSITKEVEKRRWK